MSKYKCDICGGGDLDSPVYDAECIGLPDIYFCGPCGEIAKELASYTVRRESDVLLAAFKTRQEINKQGEV